MNLTENYRFRTIHGACAVAYQLISMFIRIDLLFLYMAGGGESSGEWHQRFSRNALIWIICVFLVVVGIVISIHTYEQIGEFKKQVRTVNNVSIYSLEKSIQFRYSAYRIYDSSLDERMKKALIPFYEAYMRSGGAIETMNLSSIREKTGEDPSMVDLYVINSSDVVVASTNSQDLSLNFTESAPRFARFLDEIRNKTGFFLDQVTTEIKSPQLRKWAYMPTPDHRYILEIGFTEKTFGVDHAIVMNLSEISKDVASSNPYIRAIHLWDFKRVLRGSSGDGYVGEPDPRIKELFSSNLSRITDLNNGIPVRELLCIRSNKSAYGYESSLVAQVDTNQDLVNQIIREIYIRMLILFLLVGVISGVILTFTINWITRPIHGIIDDIEQISRGDHDHLIRDTGIAELTTLSRAIYTMKESILRSQSANLQLAKENEYLNKIIESIPEAILIVDVHHRIIGWNRAMENLTDCSRETVLHSGKEVYSRIFYPESGSLLADYIIDPGLVHAHHTPVSMQEKTLSTEGWVYVSEKRIKKYLSAFAAPVIQEDGTVTASIETIRDYTYLKAAEEALRASEEKYRILVDYSHDIIFTLDPDGLLVFLSPSWDQKTGIPRDQAIGHHIEEFCHQDDLYPFTRALSRVCHTGSCSNPFIFRIIHNDGSWRWYSTVFTPISHNEEKAVQISGVAHDITERKQIEDSLKIAVHKLSVLNSITRHDIKNQLTVLMGFLHMDMEALSDPEQLRRNEIERNVGLSIHNQLEFARLYHDIGLQEPVWQNIDEIIQSVVRQLDLSGIFLSLDISGLEIFADPMLEKVMYTLFDNSLRHGEGVTSISVFFREDDDGFTLIYSDDGVGIVERDKELIFNHGYGTNTGLGLFLSREILSLTGLVIMECGIPGEGVRFEILAKKGLFREIRKNEGNNSE